MCKRLTMGSHLLWRLIMSAAIALSASVATAHHSFSMFNTKKLVTVEGTVTDFQFSNPHTFVELDVPQADGSVSHYTLEGPSPSILKRLGWNRLTLKTGEKLKFTMLPLRDGGPGGMLHKVTLSNGKVMSAGNETVLDKE